MTLSTDRSGEATRPDTRRDTAPPGERSPFPSGLLRDIAGPKALAGLTLGELERLATEIRELLVQSVTLTGGHLGPNLGVVELTLALHRVFDSPHDRILFDTGHQVYTHKLLTGRQDFSRLRAEDGLSGYASRSESEHDVIENSHASTALSWADGLAKAHQVSNDGRRVVAVIGDGALTGGMAWEALNNIGGAADRPIVIVLNDNGRSYDPTVGALAEHLAGLARMDAPGPGEPSTRAGGNLFEHLGLRYIGPVDGHDIAAVEHALRQAGELRGPVIVHCLTRKGHGYAPALADEADRMHAVSAARPPRQGPGGRADTWTSVFSREMVRIGDERSDVIGLTAAMLGPVGLRAFAEAFPDRVFDAGIAEQHTVTSAAGLSMAGLHPVVAVYATFLNRAFDQFLMDVALHRCGVTFVLDRAGVTGDDGPSHNGVWDMSLLQVVPGVRIAAPRDADRLREELREAVVVRDAPTVVRFPKGHVGEPIPPLGRIGGMDVLRQPMEAAADVLVVAVGAMAATCLDVADLLLSRGISATVVDPRWVVPVDAALPELARSHRLVVTVEDNSRASGVGAAVAQALQDADVDVPMRTFGLPAFFPEHAPRERVLAAAGLTPPVIADAVLRVLKTTHTRTMTSRREHVR
ncbi:1-deoxy-D-xylulose-5-phosphate synthase [Streptomyces sp. NPDC087908]|uniref:1-deoxy-D-xylulose-5-phosphate synthase n=1 Tax=Streptomyces sp. NPDC087908 TaxID=3365820 RepID=UPI0037F43B19